MRVAMLGLALMLASCAAQPQPVEIAVGPPAPPSATAAVEKPAPAPVAVVTAAPHDARPVRDPPAAPPPAKLVLVVVDGDTVDVNGARWRLKGYDAPEIDRARCDAEKTAGIKAKARLQQILGAARIDTETDGRRDPFGRVLGTIRADGRNVGDILKAEGLARGQGLRSHDWCVGGAARTPVVMKSPRTAAKTACAGRIAPTSTRLAKIGTCL